MRSVLVSARRSAARLTARRAPRASGAAPAGPARPVVVVVAEAAPMRGGIATFAETITADPRLNRTFDMQLLNTGRSSNRQGGSFNLDNLRFAVVDAWRTWLAAWRSDIVHVQLVMDPGLPVVRAAALCLAGSLGPARLIAHVHSAAANSGRPEFADYSGRDRRLLTTLRRAALVCTVSRAGEAFVRDVVPGVPVLTVDNAVDVEAFRVTPVDHQPPTALFVGVVCRRKGTLELARAVAALRERGTELELVVVGGQGPTPEEEYAEIVAEFARLGLSESLVGQEHGAQVRARLEQADLFVLPSFLEGQPIAIIEAMASGLPVVGTTIGAVPDLVRDGVDGRVVEPGDVPALAEALESLARDPETRTRMSASIRARAEQGHSLDTLARQLDRLYTAVLDGSPVSGAGTSPTD